MATKRDLRDSTRTLMAYLQEVHQEEIDNHHYGDQQAKCSYCIEIDRARKLLES